MLVRGSDGTFESIGIISYRHSRTFANKEKTSGKQLQQLLSKICTKKTRWQV